MRTVLVTGAGGGIGTGIVSHLRSRGWDVFGLDRVARQEDVHLMDLEAFATQPEARSACREAVECWLGGRPLHGLVNNAALQRLGGTQDVTQDDWDVSMRVNMGAPFFLVQTFLAHLARDHGAVVNVGSIHAQQTKPGFVAYATSKAALVGLTRSLAVDLGGVIRVNALCPAAIDTEMLRAGFSGDVEGFSRLETFHPAGRIGSIAEAARAVEFLLDPQCPFLTGTILGLDGGIASRLHDPA